MTIINKIKQDRSLRFAILFIFLFCLFYGFNQFCIGITSPGNLYSPWLAEHLNYIRGFRHLLLRISALILQAMGYETSRGDMILRVIGHGGIILVYSCLGFGVMSFFAAFVLAWPNKSLREKIWFLLGGLLLIQSLNVSRFILISLYGNKKLAAIGIDHHDAFNVVLYTALLSVIYLWINKGKRKQYGKQPGAYNRTDNRNK